MILFASAIFMVVKLFLVVMLFDGQKSLNLFETSAVEKLKEDQRDLKIGRRLLGAMHFGRYQFSFIIQFHIFYLFVDVITT